MPLFVSHTQLARRRTLPRAVTEWALDSGAFSEIAQHGQFLTTSSEYVAAVRRYRDEIGNLTWAAQQDHMCESFVLAHSTLARTVEQAQQWTVDNFVTLRTLDASLPIIPVLQGQSSADYQRCVDLFAHRGVDLYAEPLVGLGSVCRRQNTDEIGAVIAALDDLPLHGFGVKAGGIARYGWLLASADSLAWSYAGRRIRPCPESTNQACQNCLHQALDWRARVLAAVDQPPQPIQLALA